MKLYNVNKLFNQYNTRLRERLLMLCEICDYRNKPKYRITIINRSGLHWNYIAERKLVGRTYLIFNTEIQRLSPLIGIRIVTFTVITKSKRTQKALFRRFYKIPYGKHYRTHVIKHAWYSS